MPICPNKNLDSWKSLIAALKEKLPKANDADIDAYAHLGFIRKGDGSIPTIEDVNSLVFKNATKTIQADAKEAFKAFKVGKRVGEKATAEEQKQFTKAVSAYLKSVPDISNYVSDTQLKAITRRAAKAVQSEADFAKFTQYFDKVIESAEFSQDVETAKELQKKLKDAFADAAKIVGRLKRVPVEELSPESVKLFNQVAQNFIDSKKPVTSKSYMPFDVQAASNALETISKDVQESLRASVEESYGVLGLTDEQIKYMEDIMTSEDIDAYLSNFDEAKRVEARDNIIRVAQYAQIGLKNKLELDESAFTNKYAISDVKKLKEIADFNISKIDNTKQIAELIRFIDNAVLNNSLSDITSAYAIIKATADVNYLANLVSKSKTFKINKFSKFYYDAPIILKSIFADRSLSGPIRNRTGVDAIGTAESQRDVEVSKQDKAFDAFIKKQYKGTGDSYTSNNDLVVGLYADLTNVRPEDPDVSYNENKKQLELSIDIYKKSEDPVQQQMGEYLGLIYDVSVKNSNTRQEFIDAIKQSYPNEVSIAEFAKTISDKYLPELKRHAELDANEPFSERQGFITSKRYVKVTEEVLFDTEQTNYDLRRDIFSPKESPRIIERKLKGVLPKGKAVDYRFKYNFFKNLRDQIFAVRSYEAARKLKYMSELPKFAEVFGGNNNASFFTETQQARYSVLRNGGKRQEGYIQDLMNIARIAKNIGSVIALGRVSQIVSQSVVLTNLAAQSPKYASQVLSSSIPIDLPLYESAPIYARGQQKGAIGRSEGEDALAQTTFKRGISGAIEKWLQLSGKGREITMTPLVGIDAFAAKKSFLVYYLEYMNEKAKIPTTVEDLLTEHTRIDDIRRDALSYAQQAVEETQGVSERTMMSSFKANMDNNAINELIKGLVLPFNNFASNAKARMLVDINKTIYGNNRQKIEAYKDLQGTLIEVVFYNAVNAYFVGGILRFGLNKMFGLLFDMEDDEEFYEFMSRRFKVWYTGVAKEILASGFGQAAEEIAINTLNRLAYQINKKSYEESGIDYYEWLRKDPVFQRPYRPDANADTEVINNILIGLNVYGTAPLEVMKAMGAGQAAITGEVVIPKKTPYGKEKVVTLDPNERWFYAFMSAYKGFAVFTGISDADINRSLESVQRATERRKTPPSRKRRVFFNRLSK